MTWTAKGSLLQAAGTGQNSIATANVAVGDLIVLFVTVNSPTVFANGISGGNVTWDSPQGHGLGTVNNWSITCFTGKTTSTAASSATVTYSGTVTTFQIYLDGQEFASSVGAWAVDAGPGFLDPGSAGTVALPSLTPTGAGDLYADYELDAGAAVAGSTSGYVYTVDGNTNSYTYNVNCTSATQSPTLGTGSNVLDTLAILVKEVSTAAPPPAVPFRPVTRRFRSQRIRGPWTPRMVPPSGAGPVSVSDSETFSASDGGEAVTATLSSADTAAASDGTEKIAFSTAETGSAAESGAIGVSGSDSGSGSEGGTITVSSPDSGTASEATSIAASLSDAEAASAGEAQQVTVQGSDTATGTDSAGPPNATLSSAEAASASETGVINVSASEVGTATENQAVSVQITDSDSFSASESQQVTVQTSDSASATEAGSTTATLSGSDTGSATEGGTIGVSASDAGSAAESTSIAASLSSPETASAVEAGVIHVSAADTGTAAEVGTVTSETFPDADTATATEGNQVIRLSDADSAHATDGGEGGTGGTQVADTDSWHGEDSGFTFLSSSDTASMTDSQGLVSIGVVDSVTAADTNTIAWRQGTDTASADDELKTLFGPAVSDADTATLTEGPGRFPFSDADSFAMTDAHVLNVWSGWAPYTYLGGRERRIHGPDGRVVASTDHVDPLFLRLAQKIAEAETVQWVHDEDSASTSESTVLHGLTVSVVVSPAITVTVEISAG